MNTANRVITARQETAIRVLALNVHVQRLKIHSRLRVLPFRMVEVTFVIHANPDILANFVKGKIYCKIFFL